MKIEVIIDNEGDVTVKVIGTKGLTCIDMTRDLERLLSGEVAQRTVQSQANHKKRQTQSVAL